jgi:hypothetical protein
LGEILTYVALTNRRPTKGELSRSGKPHSPYLLISAKIAGPRGDRGRVGRFHSAYKAYVANHADFDTVFGGQRYTPKFGEYAFTSPVHAVGETR